MEDGRLHQLRHLGAVLGGAGIDALVGGEADLVVDDDVNGAAGVKPAGLRHLEGFHHHALAGKGRVAVQENGHNHVAIAVVAAVLAGPHRPLNHRAGDLQVRGIERQRQVHLAAGCHHVRRETLVVLHVALPSRSSGSLPSNSSNSVPGLCREC